MFFVLRIIYTFDLSKQQKAMKIKRFRVFDIEEQKLIGKFDTIEECVKILMPLYQRLTLPATQGGNPYLDYFVDDVHDDIEVNWVDLLDAWINGERPEDLTMF
jgi:hypothetical protein